MDRFNLDKTQKSAPPGGEYLLIDAASLESNVNKISDKYFGGTNFRISLNTIPRRFNKIFYYDAIPRKLAEEDQFVYENRISSKLDQLKRIGRTNGVHVFEGEAVRRKRRGLEQKMVDVKLAVDLLTCSYRRLAPKVTVLTGDLDLYPAFEAVQSDGLYVTLWYPPDGVADELMRVADVRAPLLLDDLRLLIHTDQRDSFRLPIRRRSDDLRELGLPVGKWRDPTYGPCRIYRHGITWTIAIPSLDEPRTRDLYSSDKLDLLQNYVLEQGISAPNIQLEDAKLG